MPVKRVVLPESDGKEGMLSMTLNLQIKPGGVQPAISEHDDSPVQGKALCQAINQGGGVRCQSLLMRTRGSPTSEFIGRRRQTKEFLIVPPLHPFFSGSL